ncbi:endonuclease/exonuclease/phosphatase family protein [Wenyingzhuangia sp. 1_MG-2023]|nr:endonuclease/exonuclease/phosphatase family protein [Wenyingzhuangia sp. 1_MG-2023]
MKKIIISFIILINSTQFMFAQSYSRVKVLSANIRVALQEDEIKNVGWSSRKDLVFKVIKNQNPDIICLQEVIEIQNNDFKKAFKKFKAIGYEGPEMDPYKDGSYHKIAKNPILYNQQKYELVAAGQYWLSDTPQIAGSMAWNTSRARNVNWVRLVEKSTGKQFRVLNTHLDHKSIKAKEHQIKMIIEEANQYQQKFPQILAGDFNSDQGTTVVKIIKNYWKDSYGVLHENKDSGFTAHGFQGNQFKSIKGKIDFIFYKGSITPLDASVIKDDFKGKYPSDHYFITAELSIK